MTAAPQDPDADDVPARRDALASGADSSGLTPERLLDLAERMAVVLGYRPGAGLSGVATLVVGVSFTSRAAAPFPGTGTLTSSATVTAGAALGMGAASDAEIRTFPQAVNKSGIARLTPAQLLCLVVLTLAALGLPAAEIFMPVQVSTAVDRELETAPLAVPIAMWIWKQRGR
jgi:hypothetical protein